MKVLVASKNQTKINGALEALENYYDDIEIEGVSVESGVSEQPIDKETFDGAKNRVKALKEYAVENDIDADLYISLESGLITHYGNHFVTTVSNVLDNEDNMSIGLSPTYPIPSKYVDRVLDNNLSIIAKDLFNEDNAGMKSGLVHFLTKGQYSRKDLNKSAVTVALTSHLYKDKWM